MMRKTKAFRSEKAKWALGQTDRLRLRMDNSFFFVESCEVRKIKKNAYQSQASFSMGKT